MTCMESSWTIVLTPNMPILCRHIQVYTLGRLSIDGFSFERVAQFNLEWIFSKLDSGFLVLDSGFQSPGFRIPKAKNSWIPESGFPYMGRMTWWSRKVFLPRPITPSEIWIILLIIKSWIKTELYHYSFTIIRTFKTCLPWSMLIKFTRLGLSALQKA